MAKRLHGGNSPLKDQKYKEHYVVTQKNLDKKGKTNKKLKSNSQASKFLTSLGKEIKEKAQIFSKEHFRKGRRTKKK